VTSVNLINLWDLIEVEVYSEEDPLGRIGFRDENGQTSYYSANVSSKDAKFVDEFCQSKGISPLNTRLFKNEDGSFELKVCSALTNSLAELPFVGSHEF